jgi:hypothetical protein
MTAQRMTPLLAYAMITPLLSGCCRSHLSSRTDRSGIAIDMHFGYVADSMPTGFNHAL